MKITFVQIAQLSVFCLAALFANAWAGTAYADGPNPTDVRCAGENGTCKFSGTQKIAYGAKGKFNYKTATDEIACNNATFGDPIYGTVKACYVSSGAVSTPNTDHYVHCAKEHETCTFSGTMTVAYGANGKFNYKTATHEIACNNATFGDPIYGTVKACYTVPDDAPEVTQISKSSAPTPPTGMKVVCYDGPNSPSGSSPSSTCPVISYNGVDFWSFSYIDNRMALSLVGYKSGAKVKQIDLSGPRYVWKAEVDDAAKTVTVWGQSSKSASTSWASLTN